MNRSLSICLILALVPIVFSGGCKAVDQATGANNANVGQSLKQNNGSLTRKELAQRLRRLAMSYLGDVPEACEKIAASDLPLEQRVRALTIRANSSDSVIAIAADPDPQVSLLNMITVLTLQRMLAEERGEEFFGEHSKSYINATRRMEIEVWNLASQVLDEEEQKQLRELITQYRKDNPDEIYVWWVRFSEFSGYKETFSIASVGRGVVDIFLPVGDAVAGIESTTDVAERATWLAARQALIVQWRVELTYLQTLSAPETVKLLEDIQRVATTIDNLPKDIAKEREEIFKIIEDQNGSLSKLLKKTKDIVDQVNAATDQSERIVKNVDGIVTKVDATREKFDGTIKLADESIKSAKSILPSTESALAQLDTTAKTLGETVTILDNFTKQFESEEGEPSKPFDINEYTLAAAELGKATTELNVLVTNLDQAVQQDRIDQAFGAARGQVSALIWQGGLMLLGVGLLLILAAKWIPRRGKSTTQAA
jgi:methyl-accepting chemotaxis protein